MLNTLRVNADYWRDFHPLADHMTKLHKFTTFSLQLMFDETVSKLLPSLTISSKIHTTVSQMSYHFAVGGAR